MSEEVSEENSGGQAMTSKGLAGLPRDPEAGTERSGG
jgi:hypothetical protein